MVELYKKYEKMLEELSEEQEEYEKFLENETNESRATFKKHMFKYATEEKTKLLKEVVRDLREYL